MPAFIPTNNVFVAEIIGSLFGQAVEVTQAFLTSTAIDDTYLDGVAAEIGSQWQGQMLPDMSAQYSFVEARCTSQEVENGPVGIYIETGANAGAIADSTGLPGNATIAIKKGTIKSGKSFRGRMFLPGVPASKLVSGNADRVLSAWITSILDDLDTFYTNMEIYDANLLPVVLSKYTAGAPRANGVATPISFLSMNNQVDSQRRRLEGRGV